MATLLRQRFIHATVVWILTVLVILSALGSLSFEVFFLLSFAGFLVIVEITSPITVHPRWRRRIYWIVIGGVLVFGYLVVRRLFEILAGVI